MRKTAGIKQYGMHEIQKLIASYKQPAFRATQLIHWLYAYGALSYHEMTNLPLALRQLLEAKEPLVPPEVLEKKTSADGTQKFLLRLYDELLVEAVAIPDQTRLTVCFSTQVGCAMGCTFCSTGSVGFTRSLLPGEIVDQLLVIAREMGSRVTNAVAMGEGEPFANYDAVLSALRIMNSPNGLGIGARHLTVSTCGLIKQIERFATEPEQFTLAVSLHSAIQATRDALVPALAGQPLTALRSALVAYANKTGRRPSLEVTLIKNTNDSPEELAALIAFAKGMLCHVNLIAYNAGEPSDKLCGFEPPLVARCKEFAVGLQKAGVECTIRQSRGGDVFGACGQLKGSRTKLFS